MASQHSVKPRRTATRGADSDEAGKHRTAVVAGEQRILTIESNRSDGALDGVGVDLDPAVVEEADQLADGRYRATVGTLFQFQEICRTRDLEALVRQANVMADCRSFDDVVRALRAMQSLG